MAFLSFIISKISMSPLSNSLLPSIIAIVKSELFTASTDLSIPIFSIVSSVFLIPAVSIIFTGIPSI